MDRLFSQATAHRDCTSAAVSHKVGIGRRQGCCASAEYLLQFIRSARPVLRSAPPPLLRAFEGSFSLLRCTPLPPSVSHPPFESRLTSLRLLLSTHRHLDEPSSRAGLCEKVLYSGAERNYSRTQEAYHRWMLEVGAGIPLRTQAELRRIFGGSAGGRECRDALSPAV